MKPSSGDVRVAGKVSSLLELGAGFHPDLTGRDNVYLYGAIMGLPRSLMRERFEAVVDFADIRHFIDQPVKHYSSGMYVRLGFAVAVEADPDILLIDEVLAVGDAAFRRKCIQRMNEFKERRKTMVLVSHDLDTIRLLSDRIVFLDEGRILGDGEPGEIVRRYEAFARQKDAGGLQREWGTREVVITKVEFLNEAGAMADEFFWASRSGRGSITGPSAGSRIRFSDSPSPRTEGC